jgi:hypothetical protein
MPSVPTLAVCLEQLLITDARRVARETGTVQRVRKFDGASLAQTFVLGWLDAPTASLADLCRMAATLGIAITPTGLNKRFTPRAASFFGRLLDEATEIVLDGERPAVPLLDRFSQVVIDDSSTISLPAELADSWAGCGGSSGGEAAVKLQVRLDLCRGGLVGPILTDGRAQDKQAPQQQWPIRSGGVRITDLGYVTLGVLQRISDTDGDWLCRYHPQASICDPTGVWRHPTELAPLMEEVQEAADWEVVVGKRQHLPCRMLIQRVPPELAQARRDRLRYRAERKAQPVSPVSLALADWTILLTSLPSTRLTVSAGMALYRARWQIEWLFRLWKEGGLVDEWRTANPTRIRCELTAKLLGCVLQHWLLLDPCWRQADRSLVHAATTVRSYAVSLALALSSRTTLRRLLQALRRCLAAIPGTTTRGARPATFQRLLAAADP